MSLAIAAYGSALKRGDGGSPETFTTVAECKSMDWEISSDVIDVTTHSSAAAGAFREKISSLIDAGEISFDINLVPDLAAHVALRTDLTSRVARNWKIVFPNPALTTWSFTGVVTTFGIGMPTDDVLSASITITLTAAPTFV